MHAQVTPIVLVEYNPLGIQGVGTCRHRPVTTVTREDEFVSHERVVLGRVGYTGHFPSRTWVWTDGSDDVDHDCITTRQFEEAVCVISVGQVCVRNVGGCQNGRV